MCIFQRWVRFLLLSTKFRSENTHTHTNNKKGDKRNVKIEVKKDRDITYVLITAWWNSAVRPAVL